MNQICVHCRSLDTRLSGDYIECNHCGNMQFVPSYEARDRLREYQGKPVKEETKVADDVFSFEEACPFDYYKNMKTFADVLSGEWAKNPIEKRRWSIPDHTHLFSWRGTPVYFGNLHDEDKSMAEHIWSFIRDRISVVHIDSMVSDLMSTYAVKNGRIYKVRMRSKRQSTYADSTVTNKFRVMDILR